MGFLFGSGTKSAKIQADATLKSAELQASSDRQVARAATLSIETLAAQNQAANLAAERLSTPQEKVNVLLAPEVAAPTIDPATRRRRTARDSFFSPPTSGLNI